MVLLKVFRDQQLFYELELDPQRDYIVGRSSQSDIVLDGSPEISRSHLKVFFVEGSWKVEVLSRFGELYSGSEKVESLNLVNLTEFSVPPFNFQFIEKSEPLEVNVSSLQRDSSEPLAQSGGSDSSTHQSLAVAHVDPLVAQNENEKTQVLSHSVFPFITVTMENGRSQTYKLEGVHWTIGRDKALTIPIEDQKFSRRHMELKCEEGQYFVRDLGSSNGTTLNGDLLPPQEWVEVQSGDRLGVVDIVLEFEVRDSSFEDRWSQVPVEIREDRSLFEPIDTRPQDLSLGAPNYVTSEVLPNRKGKLKKTNWVRIASVLIVVIGLGFYLSEEPTGNVNTAANTDSGTVSAFEKLSTEKKQYIVDTYRLADRLFKEGRYEMARQEVAKIHQIIPQYEDSLQIEKYAGIAIQTQIDQRRAEEAEKERQAIELKIQQVVLECKKKVSSKIEMRIIDECLSSVIAFNPEHPEIVALRNRVETIIAERIAEKQRRDEFNALVKKRQELYSKAVQLQNEEKPLEAIEAFIAVVNSKLPDPANLSAKARREIASIQQNLQKKTAEFEKTADDQLKSGNLKAAILALQAANKVNPENEVIIGRLNSMISELKKQMQVLYQEGVLEESVGEIDSAKAKWKKIIELSIPDEDYYKKSKTKLKKYEAG